MTDQTTKRVTRASADSTRERILEAALDLFSDRGFGGATMREIATMSDVTQPLLNYHFRTKEELWRESVDLLFAELERAMASRLNGLRGVDDLIVAKLMVREFISFSAHRPQLHRTITQECKVDGPRMDWLVDRHVLPMYERTTALFATLIDGGHVPPIPPAHLYYILTGAGATMFVLGPECRRLAGLDATSPEVIETHADAVIALLFGQDRDQET